MKCASCGYKAEKGAKYCPVCGYPLLEMDDTGWEKVQIPETKPVSHDDKESSSFKIDNNEKQFNPKQTEGSFKGVDEGNFKIKDFIKALDNRENKSEFRVIIGLVIILMLCGLLLFIPSVTRFISSLNSPVVSEFLDPDADYIMLAEQDGIIYNDRGCTNKEFQDNFEDIVFYPEAFCGILICKNRDLYFINAEDLSTEFLAHSLGYGFSNYGMIMYYIDNNYVLRGYDIANRTTMVHKTVNDTIGAVISLNTAYFCCMEQVFNQDVSYTVFKVIDSDDKVISEYRSEAPNHYYNLVSVSDDGQTVYLTDLLDSDNLYCLRDGELKEIFKSDSYSELYMDHNMNNVLINNRDGLYYYKVGEDEAKELSSEDYCEVFPKINADTGTVIVAGEDNLEGTVVMAGGQYYWLNKDMELIPFVDSDIIECADVVGKDDNGYYLAYYRYNEFHYATFKDGVADDKTVVKAKGDICDLANDDNSEHIWFCTSSPDIMEVYHLFGEYNECIYDYANPNRDFDPGITYDPLTFLIYFTTPDKKLLGMDEDDELKMRIKNVKKLSYGDTHYGAVVYEDIFGSKYRVVFDKLIKVKK